MNRSEIVALIGAIVVAVILHTSVKAGAEPKWEYTSGRFQAACGSYQCVVIDTATGDVIRKFRL